MAQCLGKGEADSSILSGSTRNPHLFLDTDLTCHAPHYALTRRVVARTRQGLFGNCSWKGKYEMTDATPMLLAHAANIDFNAISNEDWSRWVDSLPLEEFISLIEISGAGRVPEGVSAAENAPHLEPHGDQWEVYVANGDYPLPDGDLVWVMFADGETMGPNRTDAFLWGGTGYAEIISYARALPGTVLPGPSPTLSPL